MLCPTPPIHPCTFAPDPPPPDPVSSHAVPSHSNLQGSGFEATTHTHDCQVCKGSGEIMVRQWNPEGVNNYSSSGSSSSSSSSMLTLPRSCPACRGSGRSEQLECKRSAAGRGM